MCDKTAGKSSLCPLVTIFFANGIGDSVLCLPAVRALSSLFAGRVKLVCAPPKAKFMFSDVPATFIPLKVNYGSSRTDKRHAPKFKAQDLAKQIGQTDILIALVRWSSPELAALVEQLRPSFSIGNGNGFSIHLPWRKSNHMADNLFDAPRFFDPEISLEAFSQPPCIPASSVQRAERVMRAFPAHHKLVAVHLDTQADKEWELSKCAKVFTSLLAEHPDLLIALIGMPSAKYKSLCNHPRIVSCLGLSLPTTVAILQSAHVFFGVDSCFLHFADLLRVPGVGLFNPTMGLEWGLFFGNGISIQSDSHITNIEADHVIESLESLIEVTAVGLNTLSVRRQLIQVL